MAGMALFDISQRFVPCLKLFVFILVRLQPFTDAVVHFLAWLIQLMPRKLLKCASHGCNAVCNRRQAPFVCFECLPNMQGLNNARAYKIGEVRGKLKSITTPQMPPWMQRAIGSFRGSMIREARRRLRVKTSAAAAGMFPAVEAQRLATAEPTSQMVEVEPEESTCPIRQRHSGSHHRGTDATDFERLPAEVTSPLLRANDHAPSRQAQSLFHVSVKPIADDQKPVTRLYGLLADNYTALHLILGEQIALRLMSQFSALLNYIPATETLEPVGAYAAACVLVSYELVGSWEDEVYDAIKGHIRSMADDNAPEVRRCMYELMNWMGSRTG